MEEEPAAIDTATQLYRSLRAFYAAHAPDKLQNIPSICAKYEGRDDKLKAFLEHKYQCKGEFDRIEHDLGSEGFNPLRALYGEGTQQLVPVQALDNISKCRVLVSKCHSSHPPALITPCHLLHLGHPTAAPTEKRFLDGFGVTEAQEERKTNEARLFCVVGWMRVTEMARRGAALTTIH